jgi:response regulator NasT
MHGGRKLRVLLVDSDPDRAAAVEAGLTEAGWTVVAIASDAADTVLPFQSG